MRAAVDWPECTRAAPHGQVLDITRELTSHLGAGERTQVFAGTAARVYHL